MMNTKDLFALARGIAIRGSPSGSRAGRPITSLSDDSGWELAYRAVEHGKARKICENKKVMVTTQVKFVSVGKPPIRLI